MAEHPHLPDPTTPRQWFYHLAGGVILPLNKVRHALAGYRTPRPFPLEDIRRAVAYDAHIVSRWEEMGRAGFGG
ncbi:MAG: hypothetical protein HKN20_07785, partial [Gemmatimonadetes bacterium]|nr:hypothetical protein [Gemmatimonadota bacterium]